MINFKAVKTISGGLYHSLISSDKMELNGRDWELLCSHLKIPPDTIHSVEFKGDGFQLQTKDFTFRYRHNGFDTDKRTVEIVG
jgi:hypothetical protein